MSVRPSVRLHLNFSSKMDKNGFYTLLTCVTSILSMSVGPSVGPSVRRSVGPSVRPSVRRSVRGAFFLNRGNDIESLENKT